MDSNRIANVKYKAAVCILALLEVQTDKSLLAQGEARHPVSYS